MSDELVRIAQGATWDRRTKTLRLSVYVTE